MGGDSDDDTAGLQQKITKTQAKKKGPGPAAKSAATESTTVDAFFKQT